MACANARAWPLVQFPRDSDKVCRLDGDMSGLLVLSAFSSMPYLLFSGRPLTAKQGNSGSYACHLPMVSERVLHI